MLPSLTCADIVSTNIHEYILLQLESCSPISTKVRAAKGLKPIFGDPNMFLELTYSGVRTN